MQLHDADAPHDAHEVHGDEYGAAEGGNASSGSGGGGGGGGGSGDEFRCNTEKNADYGGPIAFVWV